MFLTESHRSIQPIISTCTESLDLVHSWEVNRICTDHSLECEPIDQVVHELDFANVNMVVDYLSINPDAIHVSVNVRMGILSQDYFGLLLNRIKAMPATARSKLTIEIVEHGAFASPTYSKDMAIARGVLLDLHRIGVQIALDDYGYGHNSPGLLPWNVWTEIKVGGGIVSAAGGGDRASIRVLESTVQLIHDLGAKATLEYIENEQALALALRVKADFVQGYYVGRPRVVDMNDLLSGRFDGRYECDRMEPECMKTKENHKLPMELSLNEPE